MTDRAGEREPPLGTPAAARGAPARDLPRSAGAVVAGTCAVMVLAVGTDELLHLAHVFPGWGYPMPEPALNVLALAYRGVYTILGAALTARLAPRNPGRHLVAFATVGFVLGSVGAIATWPMHLGPAWYPIAVACCAWPCAALGGLLARRAPQAPRS